VADVVGVLSALLGTLLGAYSDQTYSTTSI